MNRSAKPWVIDAKDIEPVDVSSFSDHLFYTSTQIDRFVRGKGANIHLVSGPKGVGKTLVLKLKRHSLQGSSTRLIPDNQLLDKFIGVPYIFSLKEMKDLLETEEYWKSIWLISLMVTVIKSSPDFDDADIIDDLECDDLVKIVANGNIASACDIFHKLLGMSRKDYYSAYRDLGDCLLPRIRSFHSPVAIFIDNVDEYFNRAVSYSDRSRVEDDIRHTLWVNAQLGLAKAAREINSVNNHIKVFASVRQEAFQISRRRDPLALQILGNTLQLEYDFDDLKEVLLKNIEAEDVRNLVSPSAQDPIERFFGKHASVIEHSYTNEDESIINFILRHTLMRPRDIALLGGRIAEIPPSRRTPNNVRDAVYAASVELAENYLTDARVSLTDILEDVIFSLLRTNVLTRAEMHEISIEYDRRAASILGTMEQRHIFCDLYRMGLVGYVKTSGKNEAKTQFFARPGSIALEPKSCIPESEYYLVHPVLYDYVAGFRPDFLHEIDSLNIVGHGRPWREVEDIFFVLKADVAKYSEIMANPDQAPSFPAFFKKTIDECCRNIFCVEIEGGDSLLLIDRNWMSVARAFTQIDEKLQRSIYQRRLRAGADAGIVGYSLNGNKKPCDLRGGALRKAARIEPIGIPGRIVASEYFVACAEQIMHCSASELSPEQLPKAQASGGKFDLAKNATEPTQLERLFVLSVL